MSLFVGNISKSVTSSELEKLFGEYGSCRINYKGSYAFAEYDHEKDAEEAQENLQSRDMGGRKINIEWSKKSRKFDESKSRRRRSISPRRNDGRCYNCGRKGHYLRDCKSSRRHSRSRSRSHGRRRRSSSRDRRHSHRSSRRRSRSRSSRSHSYRRKGRKGSSGSSSSSRSRRRSPSSRDKSPYEKKRRSSEEKKERNSERNGHKSEEKKEKRESRSRSRGASRSHSRRSERDRSPDEKK